MIKSTFSVVFVFFPAAQELMMYRIIIINMALYIFFDLQIIGVFI
jgi:hypothetical protein